MNQRNYQRELSELLTGQKGCQGKKKRLLLHCCCAPCSSYVLEYLHPYFDITVFFYNPNIVEETEYLKRKRELRRYLSEVPFGSEIHTLEADYDPAHYIQKVKGHECDPERGERCGICFHMRLSETAKRAAEGEYDYFCTTLSISPHKSADRLMTIGEELAERYGVPYLPSDFKKKNGYKRSIELSKQYDLYRQDYCGCIFSRSQREMKDRKTFWSGPLRLLCVVFCLCLLVSCGEAVIPPGSASGGAQAEERKLSKEIYAMDTIMDLTIYGNQKDGTILSDEKMQDVMNQAVEQIHHLESLLSVTETDSDVSRINAASGTSVSVSSETYELLEKCLGYSEETEGLFDISIYPLVRAWGFTTEEYRVPSEQEKKEVRERIDYKKIQLTGGNQVRIDKTMQIDLGAAAKGYLSQKLMDLFKKNGVPSAIVSLGGNVQTIGRKPDGSRFRVGITDPADGTSLYGTLDIEDRAVITSGIYQRYFEKDGQTYHHIMDKRTGGPAENTLASVTVIAREGTAGDALATALYVMGEDGARQYQKEHPEIGLILIRKDGSSWQSDGIAMQEIRK